MQEIELSIHKAINWILSNRNQLRIDNIPDWKRKMILLKPIGEFVLTLDVLSSQNANEIDVYENLKWSWQQFDEGNLLTDILLARPDLIIVLSIYSNFTRHGFRCAKFETLAEYLLSLNSIKYIEFPLWRKIDLDYSVCKLYNNDYDITPHISKSWIGNFPEPWTINDDFAYSMTHEVFYATDFGNKIGLSNQLVEYLKFWLPTWLKLYRRVPNWDIFAELIMVSECISIDFNNDKFVQLLISSQLEDGLFPSPIGGGGNLISRTDSIERITFLGNYHTTFVSLMALCMHKNNKNKKAANKALNAYAAQTQPSNPTQGGTA